MIDNILHEEVYVYALFGYNADFGHFLSSKIRGDTQLDHPSHLEASQP